MSARYLFSPNEVVVSYFLSKSALSSTSTVIVSLSSASDSALYSPLTVTVISLSPLTRVSEPLLIVTVFPSASTTLPPSSTSRFDTVQSAVTVHVESSLTLISTFFFVTSPLTVPVQLLPLVSESSALLMLSTLMSPATVCSLHVTSAFPPLLPDVPQLFESFPTASRKST